MILEKLNELVVVLEKLNIEFNHYNKHHNREIWELKLTIRDIGTIKLLYTEFEFENTHNKEILQEVLYRVYRLALKNLK